MKIPTKNDFIQNRSDAIENLFLYMKHVFYYKDEDDVSDFISELLDDNENRWKLLNSFFDRFGEIEGHEEEFKHFFNSYMKNKIKRRTAEEESDENFSMDIYDGDANWNLDADAHIDDSNPTGEIKIREDSEQNIKFSIFGKLIERILQLSEKEQARFKVAFLSIQNTLNIGQAPSDMPKQVSERIQKIAKGDQLSFDAKKQYLMKYLYPSGFWQKYWEDVGYTLIDKDSEKQREKYELLFKKAKFSNTTRDKEKMAKIVDDINLSDIPQELHSKLLDIKMAIKKDITGVNLRSELREIHEYALSPRDIATRNFRYIGCKEYSDILPLYVKARLENNNSFFDKPIVTNYLKHRRICNKCRECEKDIEPRIAYRLDRLASSPYKFHASDNNNLNITKSEDLIRYYKNIDKHYSSDLSKLYLLLAYMVAGKKDEVQKLRREIEIMK